MSHTTVSLHFCHFPDSNHWDHITCNSFSIHIHNKRLHLYWTPLVWWSLQRINMLQINAVNGMLSFWLLCNSALLRIPQLFYFLSSFAHCELQLFPHSTHLPLVHTICFSPSCQYYICLVSIPYDWMATERLVTLLQHPRSLTLHLFATTKHDSVHSNSCYTQCLSSMAWTACFTCSSLSYSFF